MHAPRLANGFSQNPTPQQLWLRALNMLRVRFQPDGLTVNISGPSNNLRVEVIHCKDGVCRRKVLECDGDKCVVVENHIKNTLRQSGFKPEEVTVNFTDEARAEITANPAA